MIRGCGDYTGTDNCRARFQNADTASVVTADAPSEAIILTEKAVDHIKKLRQEVGGDLLLRVGVKQGGCSGMSYVMDFEKQENLKVSWCRLQCSGPSPLNKTQQQQQQIPTHHTARPAGSPCAICSKLAAAADPLVDPLLQLGYACNSV